LFSYDRTKQKELDDAGRFTAAGLSWIFAVSISQSITQSINQDLIQVDKPQEDRVKLMHMLK